MTRYSPTGPGLPVYSVRAGRERSRTGRIGLALRFAGAVALLVTGAVQHLQQVVGAHYADIPTIGTLFALNFAGATLLALGLLAPLERLTGRVGSAAVALSALGGIALAAASIVFLLISENQTLFGFRESGYRLAIVVALIAESAAVILLGLFLVVRAAGKAQQW